MTQEAASQWHLEVVKPVLLYKAGKPITPAAPSLYRQIQARRESCLPEDAAQIRIAPPKLCGECAEEEKKSVEGKIERTRISDTFPRSH